MRSKIVEEALEVIPRARFLWPSEPIFLAYADEPSPLGDSGQTITAPHMVVLMLESLELASGNRVLEIGCGSGYNAALMGWIVSRGSRVIGEPLVISIERNDDLANFARKNIQLVGLSGIVKVISGDGSLGYPQGSRDEIYDRILVAAAAPRVPTTLKRQLKDEGIMEVPVGGDTYQTLTKLKKKGTGEKAVFETTNIVECAFVPLIGAEGFK